MPLAYFRPLARLLRKKIFLAIVFALSFGYCTISLLRDSGGRSRTLVGSSLDVEYDGEGMEPFRMFGFRRGLGSTKEKTVELIENHNHILVDTLKPNEGDANEISTDVKNCRNSVQGKALIADDQGYVCSRKDLAPSGCCTQGAASSRMYNCDTCTESGCCAIFEYCVSCCLEPAKKPLLLKLISGKSNGGFPSNVLYASLTDHFEFCLAKCRTSSQSVHHENSYRDPKNKHCYGESVTTTKDVSVH
ncbi:hypothetical protein HDE_13036 [Halotydeus destructor]|nr:hypothetical protein HDE_13036 [Halotydeus destructor]